MKAWGFVKKHVRATQQGQQAGIVAVEAPIHRSNVMVIDPETKQPTRVRIVEKEEARDGKVKTVRVRVAKKSGKDAGMTDTTVEAPATPRLKQKYNEQMVPELEKEFHYSNPMQVARVQKVVVSMGVGAAARDSKLIEGAVKTSP